MIIRYFSYIFASFSLRLVQGRKLEYHMRTSSDITCIDYFGDILEDQYPSALSVTNHELYICQDCAMICKAPMGQSQ